MPTPSERSQPHLTVILDVMRTNEVVQAASQQSHSFHPRELDTTR